MKDVLKVDIENIQAVKKASFEIEGFTAVVGRSNSGKSSLIRGIHAALTNKSPKTIFRTGTTQSLVKLEDVSKNISIEWKKGDKINAYTINGNEFTKVGKDVPKDIEEFGFKEIRVNDESLEVQFAKQHEYIFLLNRSGGFIADFISKITKADVLTGAVKDCESDIRKCNESIKAAQKEKDSLDIQLQRFASVNSIESDLDETVQGLEQSLSLQSELTYLNKSISLFEVLQKELKNLKIIPEIISVQFDVNVIEDIDSYIKIRESLRTEISNLSGIPEIYKIDFDIKSLSDIQSWVIERDTHKNKYIPLKNLNDISIPCLDFKIEDLLIIDEAFSCLKKQIKSIPALPEVSMLSEKIAEIDEIDALKKDYLLLYQDKIDLQKKLDDNVSSLKELMLEKKYLQDELGECPTCGRGFNAKEKDCSTDSR